MELFHHCVSVEQKDGCQIPRRLTAGQLAHYQHLGEGFRLRSVCTAGITMEFTTEQREISFGYRASDFCRDHNAVDLYEDGAFAFRQAITPEQPKGTFRYTRKADGPSEIRIYLSAMACLAVHSINFGAWVPVPATGPRLLFLGDSITQGIQCSGPSQSHVPLLGRRLSADFLNQGVGMHYFDALSLPAALPFSPDQIVVAYGTNDFETTGDPDRILPHAQQYLAVLRERFPTVPTVLVSPLWRANREKDPAFCRLGKELVQLAERLGCTGVDGGSMIAHDPALFTDGLHPNDQGFLQYAEHLEGSLRQNRPHSAL